MNPLQLIQLHEQEFTKSELKIMKYITTHLDIISSYPLLTVAEKCKVSKSALLRFCQKCGYRGYSEFKYEISRYLQSAILIDEDIDTKQTLINIYTKQISNLLDPHIINHIHQLSYNIIHAKRIRIYGIHETGLSVQYLSYRLATLGIDSEPITYPSQLAEKASFSKIDDLNIFFSLSAQTTVICDALTCALETHSYNVLITQNNYHKFKNKINLSIIIPTFQYEKKNIFLDAQALLMIAIDLLINDLAKTLKDYSLYTQ